MSGSLVKPYDRWISLAFQAGSRDKFNGDLRMTRRCRAHVPSRRTPSNRTASAHQWWEEKREKSESSGGARERERSDNSERGRKAYETGES